MPTQHAPGQRGPKAMTPVPEPSSGVRFFLQHADGERAGIVLPLEGERVTIGRSLENLCALVTREDRGVSLQHCDIRRTESGFELVDCGSLNGTWLNGQRIRRERLVEGDVIGLGRKGPRLVFSLTGEPRLPEDVLATVAAREGRAPGPFAEGADRSSDTWRPRRASPWRRHRIVLLSVIMLLTGGAWWWSTRDTAAAPTAADTGAAAIHARGLARLVLAEPVAGGGWLHTDLAPALIAADHLVLIAGPAFDLARERLIATGGRLVIAPESGLASAHPVLGVRSAADTAAVLLETAPGLPCDQPPRFATSGNIALAWRIGLTPRPFTTRATRSGTAWRLEDNSHGWDLLLSADGIAGLGSGTANAHQSVRGEELGLTLARYRTAPLRLIE